MAISRHIRPCTPILRFAPPFFTGLAGFDNTGHKIYLLDSRERNTAALKIMDPRSREVGVLAKNDRADISGVIVLPTEKHVQAVTFTRREWQILEESIRDDPQ